jgi:hypothetical protein
VTDRLEQRNPTLIDHALGAFSEDQKRAFMMLWQQFESAEIRRTGEIGQLWAAQRTVAAELTAIRARSDGHQQAIEALGRLIAIGQERAERYEEHRRLRELADLVIREPDTALRLDPLDQRFGIAEYWLAPALAALAASVRDDPVAADRKLAAARHSADPETAAFLGLALHHAGHAAAAEEWIVRWLAQQDPGQFAPESTAIVELLVSGAAGNAARAAATAYAGAWFEAADRAQPVRAAQILRWLGWLAQFAASAPPVAPLPPAVNDAVAQHLTTLIARAAVYESAGAAIAGIIGGDPDGPARLETARLEPVLRRLVAVPSPGEQALERRIQELNAAPPAPAAPAATHFGTLLTDAALGGSTALQPLAVVLSRGWIAEAARQVESSLAADLPRALPVLIGDRTYQLDLPADKTAVGAVEGEIRQHRIDEVDLTLRRQRVTILALLGGAVAALALSAGAFAERWIIAGGVLVIVATVLGVWMAFALRERPAQAVMARNVGQGRTTLDLEQLRRTATGLRTWEAEWRRRTGAATDLHRYLESLSP